MYIAIEGVIGVGKTTLARLLQPAFQSALLLEALRRILSYRFLRRPGTLCFSTQIFFLLSRYHQQRRTVQEVVASGVNLISDYTFEKDSLFARINLHGDELEMYYRVHEALAEKIPPPDLIVYLRASPGVLMQRIASRDRSYERNMEFEYIAQLHGAYEDFFGDSHQGAEVLSIDTDQLDYVKDSEALKYVEERLRQALKLPPFQWELPLEGHL
jgi:deoxyguanosine kinase